MILLSSRVLLLRSISNIADASFRFGCNAIDFYSFEQDTHSRYQNAPLPELRYSAVPPYGAYITILIDDCRKICRHSADFRASIIRLIFPRADDKRK